MASKFLGVPWLVWSAVAFLVAVVYAFVWPGKRVTVSTSTLQYLILRWGHTLVWLLLGLAALLRAIVPGASPKPSIYMAISALAVYIMFNLTLVTSKQ